MEDWKPIVALNPEKLSEPVKVIGELTELKRWYELGLQLLLLFDMPEVSGHKKEIFDKVIFRQSALLDPFHFTRLVILAASEISDPSAGIAFLEELRDGKVFEKLPEPKDLLNLRIVEFLCAKSAFEDAHALLNSVESRVNSFTPVIIRSSLHRTQTILDKARNDWEGFYRHAFMFLSTSHNVKDPELAYNLCASALFADSVCSFGEVAAHPILESLAGTENAWLADLIKLLDVGSPESIETYNERFAPLIARSPVLGPHAAVVQRKLALSVFLEMIFERPFDQRTFTFQSISDACKIPKDRVEHMVLKAMATGVIRGTIDEVAERVVVTWCKPKALGAPRLTHLKEELDRWIGLVHNQRVSLEERAHDVVG